MTWEELYSGVKNAAKNTAEKINQTADIATIQVKISLAERKLNKAYERLGQVAYGHFSGSESDATAVANAMKDVALSLDAIQKLKDQFNAAKAGASGADSAAESDVGTKESHGQKAPVQESLPSPTNNGEPQEKA